MSEPVWSPVILSRPNGQKQVSGNQWVGFTVATWLGPPAIGFLLLKAVELLVVGVGIPRPVLSGMGTAGALLLMSGVPGIVVVPASVAIFAIMMRLGFAGIAATIVAALMVHLPIWAAFFGESGLDGLVRTVQFFGGYLVFYAIFMWGVFRALCPEALLP